MAVTVFKSASIILNDTSVGNQKWLNLNNGKLQNNNYIDNTALASSESNYVTFKCLGFTNADIPVGATIDGIEVLVEGIDASLPAGQTISIKTRIIKGNVIQSTDVGSITYNTTDTDSYSILGGATQKWGTTWVDTDIKSSGFGFATTVDGNTPGNIFVSEIDHAKIRVYYTVRVPMAVGNIISADTESLYGTKSSSGTVTIDTSGGRPFFKCDGNSISRFEVEAYEGGAIDKGDDRIYGFRFKTDDLTPATRMTIFIAENSDFSLTLETSGRVGLLDANGTFLGSITYILQINVEYYFETRHNRHATAGNWEMHIDNILRGFVSNQDFVGAGALMPEFRYGSNAGFFGMFRDIYFLSGAMYIDRKGPRDVFYYQGNLAPTETGDAPSVGSKVDSQETPPNDSNLFSYNGSSMSGGLVMDGGSRAGPKLDKRITGTIEAVKYIYRMDRDGGGNTTHKIRYGNSNDTMQEEVVTVGGSPGQYFKVTEDPTIMPTKTEYFQIEVSVSGPQDLNVQEMWCAVLHAPADPIPIVRTSRRRLLKK